MPLGNRREVFLFEAKDARPQTTFRIANAELYLSGFRPFTEIAHGSLPEVHNYYYIDVNRAGILNGGALLT